MLIWTHRERSGLRLGCEGVESQYRSVVWEEKKKEKNTFIRRKEEKIRERERRDTESSREKVIQTTESIRKKREFYTYGQTHRLVFHKGTK